MLATIGARAEAQDRQVPGEVETWPMFMAQ
jgi:hypothetical protein